MTLELNIPPSVELQPRIAVIGVGGAGGNAVNNMVRSGLQGVEFVVANTDAQALAHSLASSRIQLGARLTQGLGAGSKPEVGCEAAKEALDDIRAQLKDCHMAFITAGMGGGTGTGAAPVIAGLARELGILTVGVVTKPFQFEGSRRMKSADAGIEALQQNVDTLIIIPNQNLFRIATEKTTFADAFGLADEVLHSGVRGITDLMVMPGLINLDFADVQTVMQDAGKAMMGTGEAEGEGRARAAAEAAISNPLLDEVSMRGAQGVIINITGGTDMTLYEVDEAANFVREQVDPEANIIVGSAFNENLQGRMRVSVVATGIVPADGRVPMPRPLPRVVAAAPVTLVEEPVVEPVAEVAPAVEAVAALVAEVSEERPAAAEFLQFPQRTRSLDLNVTEDPMPSFLQEPASEAEDAAPPSFEFDEYTSVQDGEAAANDSFFAPMPDMPEPLPGNLRAQASESLKEADYSNAGSNFGAADADTPSPFAQRPAAVVAPEPEEDPEPARPMSLFEKMTAGFRARDAAPKRKPAVTTQLFDYGEEPMQRNRMPAPVEPLAEAPRPQQAPRGNDPLDIPSFLRRQGN